MPENNEIVRKRLESLIFAGQHFTKVSLQRERYLATTKWFDYRFISPWEATRLFAEKYREAFRYHFRANVDIEGADVVRGLALGRLMTDSRERTQAWEARQRADETGMRYEDYINASFNFALRRQRRCFPRPNQLHHSNCPTLWRDFRHPLWQEHLTEGLVQVCHVAYSIKTYRGLAAQDDYRRFILDQADSGKRSWRSSMQRYALRYRQLPVELFATRMPPEVYEKELAILESDERAFRTEPEPMPVVTPVDLWPSCFGVPHAPDAASKECATCEMSAQCQRLGEVVLGKLKAATSSLTPFDDRKRRLDRERQRCCRARKKLRQLASLDDRA
ncbi:hypothetical protein [Hoeflea sp. 108]|jgi:hypothetical protein|uniref:hypothetical protein n=1 Tax=Hoeflea sp. 108 TaxID=1116369 RepID=UPI00037BC156|nr:hypothetical protein [Hoeflea sp. 108]